MDNCEFLARVGADDARRPQMTAPPVGGLGHHQTTGSVSVRASALLDGMQPQALRYG